MDRLAGQHGLTKCSSVDYETFRTRCELQDATDLTTLRQWARVLTRENEVSYI